MSEANRNVVSVGLCACIVARSLEEAADRSMNVVSPSRVMTVVTVLASVTLKCLFARERGFCQTHNSFFHPPKYTDALSNKVSVSSLVWGETGICLLGLGCQRDLRTTTVRSPTPQSQERI